MIILIVINIHGQSVVKSMIGFMTLSVSAVHELDVVREKSHEQVKCEDVCNIFSETAKCHSPTACGEEA